MRVLLTTLLAILPSILRSRAALQLENLALRHQIGVLQRSAAKHLKLTSGDRLLWIVSPVSGATGALRSPLSSQKRSWPGIVPAFVSFCGVLLERVSSVCMALFGRCQMSSYRRNGGVVTAFQREIRTVSNHEHSCKCEDKESSPGFQRRY